MLGVPVGCQRECKDRSTYIYIYIFVLYAAMPCMQPRRVQSQSQSRSHESCIGTKAVKSTSIDRFWTMTWTRVDHISARVLGKAALPIFLHVQPPAAQSRHRGRKVSARPCHGILSSRSNARASHPGRGWHGRRGCWAGSIDEEVACAVHALAVAPPACLESSGPRTSRG